MSALLSGHLSLKLYHLPVRMPRDLQGSDEDLFKAVNFDSLVTRERQMLNFIQAMMVQEESKELHACVQAWADCVKKDEQLLKS